ncbi:Hypothetical protein SRAE_0000074100 [Strongyloides ratti]|uniref:Aspartic peptidase domain-containing protein n=1 Tax=Strongyloides ratti TaxID=34506 RepID=A0A090L2D2_STRRB|nr:Hypothetical protein SRAE_0000074100 [Strongyloides ratti]CEF61624.1 Hypothetical protein SRAE_0000074100 [Strongyloides ratti]
MISAERELDALTKPIDKVQKLEKRANKIKELTRTIYQNFFKPGIKRFIKLPTKYDDFDWELFIIEIKQTFEIEIANSREKRNSGSTFTSISNHLHDLLRMKNKIGSETKIKLIDGITTLKRAKSKKTLIIGDKQISLKDPMILNTHKRSFDILLGRDILKKYGAIINHKHGTIKWDEDISEQHLNFLMTPSDFKEHDRIMSLNSEVKKYRLNKETNNHTETNFYMKTENIPFSKKELVENKIKTINTSKQKRKHTS